MLCGHWLCMQKYDNASTQERKIVLSKNLISIFGTYTTNASSSNVYCKICGDALDIVNYDELDGFDSYGHIVRSRAIMTEKDRNPKVLDTKSSDKPYTLFLNQIECSDKQFRDFLVESGVPIENLKISFDVCNILKKLSEKIGLHLRSDDFIKILIDSINLIISIIPLKAFKAKIVSDFMKLGKTEQVRKLEETTFFEDKYYEYYNLEKLGIITCRLLISINTTIPPYKMDMPKTSCSLTGWDNGLTYFTCIIKELGILNYEIKKSDGTKKKTIIKEKDILEKFNILYDEIIKHKNIIDLFDDKKNL